MTVISQTQTTLAKARAAKGRSADKYLGTLLERRLAGGESVKLELWADPLCWIIVEGKRKHFFSSVDGVLSWLFQWLLKHRLRENEWQNLLGIRQQVEALGEEMPLLRRRMAQYQHERKQKAQD